MDKYRRMVKKNADNKSTDLIPNGGIEHAEVLIENIFSHATGVVRIFSGELNPKVYGSERVVEQAARFMQKEGCRLDILLQNIKGKKDLKDNKLVELCEDAISRGACTIKGIAQEDENMESHFVVMDDAGYRIEPDKTRPTGIGCFNDAKFAATLNSHFDAMFGRAVDIH